jgi:thioredoxin-related protein
MKLFRSIVWLIGLAVVLPVLPAAAVDQAPAEPKTDSAKSAVISWVSFDEGLKRAEAEKKNLLVDLTASWCGWCKKMERETFSDTSVINTINANYIPVKVWGDSDKMLDIKGYKISEKDLATSVFGVQGYPTFYVICSDGQKLLHKVIGYRPTDAFKTEIGRTIGINCDTLKTPEQKPMTPGK